VLLNLIEHPCMMCEDTPCITACPTEALMPFESIAAIDIGVALIDTLTCSGFRGSGCQICYDVCPLPDQAIQLTEGLPFVQENACTGCGICAHHCPDEAIEVIQKPLA
jgi:ferredoxin-type protein NapG